MKKPIIIGLLLLAALSSCTKRDGEDDDIKIILKPKTPAATTPDSLENARSRNSDSVRYLFLKRVKGARGRLK